MVIVTHELAALADIVTRIVVVQGGRIVFDGTRDEFASRTGEFATSADHHHHEDENRVTAPKLPGAPSAGPLDPRGAVRS
jgi:zinc transport system ATP-binding protein